MEKLSRKEEKRLLELLTKKFFNTRINNFDENVTQLRHGNALKILWNTNCNIKIVKFEYGNEFINERVLEDLLIKNE